MKELLHLVWGIVGAVVGFSAGTLAYLGVYRIFPDQLGQIPALALAVIFALAGGGMVGGGWLALYLATRRHRVERDKDREERSQFGSKRRSK